MVCVCVCVCVCTYICVCVSVSVCVHVSSLPAPVEGNLTSCPSWSCLAASAAHREDVVWYSDDDGASYTRTNHTFPRMDEVQPVELVNGSVLLNMRNAHATTCDCRAVARSDDAGETWSAIWYDAQLPSPVCAASIVRVGKDIFFSNPDSTRSRENMVVRRSTDGANTWSASLTIDAGPAAYSSLVSGGVDDQSGGVLYEASGGRLVLVVFPLNFS